MYDRLKGSLDAKHHGKDHVENELFLLKEDRTL